jgi:hypothetical protein
MFFRSIEKARKEAYKMNFWLRGLIPVVIGDSPMQPLNRTLTSTLQRTATHNNNSNSNLTQKGSTTKLQPALPTTTPSPAMLTTPKTVTPPPSQPLQPPTRPAPVPLDVTDADKFLATASEKEKEIYRLGLVPSTFNWKEAMEQRERERNRIHSIKMTIAKDRYIASITFNTPTLDTHRRDPSVFILKEGEYVVSIKSWTTDAIERLVFTTSTGRVCAGGNERTQGKMAEVTGNGLVSLKPTIGIFSSFFFFVLYWNF